MQQHCAMAPVSFAWTSLSNAPQRCSFFPFDLGRRLFARAPSVLRLSEGRKQAPALDPPTLKGHVEANAFSNLLLVNIVGGGTLFSGSPPPFVRGGGACVIAGSMRDCSLLPLKRKAWQLLHNYPTITVRGPFSDDSTALLGRVIVG